MELDQESSSSEQEMRDRSHDFSDPEDTGDVFLNPQPAKKRGRKKILPRWSRIIDLENDEPPTGEGFDLAEDFEALDDGFVSVPKKGKAPWKPLFHSKTFWDEHPEHGLDENIIRKRTLRCHARNICYLRSSFFFWSG